MSLIINNIALHFIKQSAETAEVTLNFGPEISEPSEKIINFVDTLHKVYNAKGSKAYGQFSPAEAETENKPFEHLLTDQINGELGFTEFGQQAAKQLTSEIAKYDIAETGYLILCNYEYMGGQFFIAAIIPLTEHFAVDGELNISAEQYLDTSKIQLAARIDLFEYKDNPESNRYVSFIKGRAGRKVADFFLDFLGCSEGLNAKEQTQNLVQAVEDFVSVQQLDADEKQQTRKELLNYCKEQKESSQDVSVKELGEIISKESDEQDFYSFVQDQAYDIEESFPHEQAIVNKVTKFSGYGAGISVSFERSHFGQEIVYNQANDSLTIYKVPPNLKDQLLKLLNEDSQH